MAYFKIIEEKNLLLYSPEGTLTAKDIIDYINNVLYDPQFKENLLEFIDLSKVEGWELGHQDVEKVTYFDFNGMGTIKKIAKTSIWAPSDISFGMARMYQSFAEKYHDNIFISKSVEDALEYLGIQLEDITV